MAEFTISKPRYPEVAEWLLTRVEDFRCLARRLAQTAGTFKSAGRASRDVGGSLPARADEYLGNEEVIAKTPKREASSIKVMIAERMTLKMHVHSQGIVSPRIEIDRFSKVFGKALKILPAFAAQPFSIVPDYHHITAKSRLPRGAIR